MQSSQSLLRDPSVREKLRRVKHFALDLDGTLYLGSKLFDFTLPFLGTLAQLTLGRTFITNNSSRSTRQYIKHLRAMGIEAAEQDICISTHATIEYLKADRPELRKLFVLGTPALQSEFVDHGFSIHGYDPADEPDGVVVGFDTTLSYPRLCSAAWWISRGKPFIATHPDRICPTDRPTLLPDCGAICAMLTHATGCPPQAILGKPDPRMLAPVLRRHGLQAFELAVVGDRLYTDIEMARRSGAIGILVLSGETTAEQAAKADPAADLVVQNVGQLAGILRRVVS